MPDFAKTGRFTAFVKSAAADQLAESEADSELPPATHATSDGTNPSAERTRTVPSASQAASDALYTPGLTALPPTDNVETVCMATPETFMEASAERAGFSNCVSTSAEKASIPDIATSPRRDAPDAAVTFVKELAPLNRTSPAWMSSDSPVVSLT